MIPYLEDPDVTIYQGDALETLRELDSDSVHMAATSPPFWALRDYSVAGQIGLEETPDQWAGSLVEVFREVRRVLRADGTLWVECGDSYAGSWGAQSRKHGEEVSGLSNNQITAAPRTTNTGSIPQGVDFKPKDLVGAPWLLAFALRADGWYLRQCICWHKPNAMPESATDRPTTAHSYVFLLSREPHYYYDQDAIREPYGDPLHQQPEFRCGSDDYTHDAHAPGQAAGPDGRRRTAIAAGDLHHENHDSRDGGERWPNPAGRNARSVWTIPTQPYKGDHYATWPEALVGRMIKAGTSEHGVCGACGAPFERLTEGGMPEGSMTGATVRDQLGQGYTGNRTPEGKTTATLRREGLQASSPIITTGWAAPCTHEHEPSPAVVLDPFAGAGTTMLAARKLGRHSIGIELNPDYCRQAAKRLQQLSLLS